MGLFSRNDSAPGSGRRLASRSSVSSEAQTRELRGRARRRLIGALALVIAAVIVVPMLLDTEPAPDQNVAPLVVPAITPPASEPASPPVPVDNNQTPLPVPDATQPDAEVASGTVEPSTDAAAQAPALSDSEARRKPESKTVDQPRTRADEKPAEAKPEPKSESKSDKVKRTDDGSVALALLEGRRPRGTAEKKSAQGSYTLQIAAYSTDKDAQVRRDRLVASGVTNAYVENAASGSKSTYRLRVGPFPTREAAQAAQARLRALGYDNGFISTK